MCGSSAQQNQLASQEASFSSLLSANYAQNFGAQSQTLQNLTNQFTPIAEAGPDQQGMGPQQLAALNTQATEGVGQNYANASRALNTQLSSQGGGNEYLPTGAAASLKGNLASSAANQLSSEQLAITNQNYNLGRSNWQNATSGLNALAGEYNPNAIAGQASGANQSAAGQAKEINQENNQWQGELAGVITGGISALSGGLGNLDTTGSSTGGEQALNFLGGI
jgi:hypothetical protein